MRSSSLKASSSSSGSAQSKTLSAGTEEGWARARLLVIVVLGCEREGSRSYALDPVKESIRPRLATRPKNCLIHNADYQAGRRTPGFKQVPRPEAATIATNGRFPLQIRCRCSDC